MKILLVNSHHWICGGTERYYFELSNLLKKKGHQVAFFSMKDPENVRTKWSKYFVSHMEFGKHNLLSSLKNLCRMFYSLESKRKIAKLLDEFKPDIVHIQNIYYYLSPSILPEIKKRGIPIVQTVHDYQLISPNPALFHDGKICEITKKNKYYKAIFHKCIINSFFASLMATIASYVQNIFSLYKKNVDFYIAPSIFMKKKLEEYGLNPKKIIKIYHFTTIPKETSKKQVKKFVVYFGRLEEKKGILFFLKVIKSIPYIKFKIIGNPIDEKEFEKILLYVKNNKIRNVEFINFQNTKNLKKLVSESLFTIIPSLWYETFCLVIIESYALGKPVVASNIGAIPEIVKNKKTGLLFKAGDVSDCKEKILELWHNPFLVKKMGKNAEKFINKEFNQEEYYKKLMLIYKKAIGK